MVPANLTRDFRSAHLKSSAQSEVEETLKRISQHKGVIGVIIANTDGKVIRTTLTDSTLSGQYAGLMTQLAQKSRSAIRDLDPLVCRLCTQIRNKPDGFVVERFDLPSGSLKKSRNHDCSGYVTFLFGSSHKI
jgi:dynein light chain roadblock-type